MRKHKHQSNTKQIVSLCVLIIMLFILCSCDSQQETQPTEASTLDLDWTMRGTWISADGTIGETIDVTVRGVVPAEFSDLDNLSLDILFGDDFRYSYTDGDGGNYVSQTQAHGLSYFVCPSYCYDRQKNESFFSYFALCPQQQYIIFSWENNPGQYLVASTDHNTDASVILEYFEKFVDRFCY